MMDTKALREKILDLAMRGKLVAQDPTDEPASELLKRIKEEKEQLIKEKKIKKEKALPEITEEEKPYVIPDSWEWVRLVEISKFGNFNSTRPENILPEKWLLELEDIEKNSGNILNKRTTVQGEIKSNKYLFHEGDILYGKLRPYLRKILIAESGGYCSTEIFPISVYSGITNKLLLYWLKSRYISEIVDAASYGVNLPRVSPQFFSSLLIPLPCFKEQERIVAKIEELFSFIDVIEQESADYDALAKQLDSKVLDLAMKGKLVPQDPTDEPANELLKRIREEKERLIKEKKIKKEKALPEITEEEKPYDIPDSWEWVRLGQISKVIQYGYTDSAKQSGDAKFLRITDIQNGKVDWSTVPYCNISAERAEDLKLINGDLLIARTGGTIGKSFLIEKVDELSVFASYLIRIQLMDKDIAKYINYFLDSSLYWYLLDKISRGSGQPNVNSTNLFKLLLPFPPLKEQERIVAKIEKIKKLL